ncbi:MAG: IS3 family transposase [Anaerolineales bacterium]|nr:IS3 family transposase [Anaerolineales bacterium]
MKTFIGILKLEFYTDRYFSSIRSFEKKLSEYIDYYNNRSIMGKQNGLSLVQLRTQSIFSIKLLP